MNIVMEFQTRINHLQYQIDSRDERIKELKAELVTVKASKVSELFLDRKEVLKWQEGYNENEENKEKLGVAVDALESLKSQLAEAEKVLEFYADRSSWQYSGGGQFDNTITFSDSSYVFKGKQRDKIGGKRAREYFANKLNEKKVEIDKPPH